jgi:hypothetical protein
MELTAKIAAHCRVVATLEESGELTVKAFAQAEYATGRTTTAEVIEIPPALRAQVEAVLGLVLEAAMPALGERIQRAVHKSTEIAASMGEL